MAIFGRTYSTVHLIIFRGCDNQALLADSLFLFTDESRPHAIQYDYVKSC